MKIVAITPHKKTDTMAQLVIEGLYENDIEVISSDEGNSVKKVYNDEEILKHAESADYIFAFWGKCIQNGIPEPKYYLLDKINKFEKSVYIDGSEWNCTGYGYKGQGEETILNSKKAKGYPWLNETMLKKCKWYFKRECYDEDERDGIIPLNVGARLCYLNEIDVEKKYDVFCSFGHLKTGLRKPVHDSCVLRSYLNKENNIIGSGYNFDIYLRYIKESFISVSAWGCGNSCRRMWEILSQGTCCFAQKKEIILPNNFTDGYNIVYYSNIKEFNEKLNYYLSKKDEIIEIGKRGRDHLIKYHTSKMRVQYILNILNGKKWKNALQ